jgi:hypothetical protein
MGWPLLLQLNYALAGIGLFQMTSVLRCMIIHFSLRNALAAAIAAALNNISALSSMLTPLCESHCTHFCAVKHHLLLLLLLLLLLF